MIIVIPDRVCCLSMSENVHLETFYSSLISPSKIAEKNQIISEGEIKDE